MITLCSEMFGGCMTMSLEYPKHTWAEKRLAVEGVDKFGGFSMNCLVENDKTECSKAYDNGLGLTLNFDGKPTDNGRFLFAPLTFQIDGGARQGFENLILYQWASQS